MRSPLRRAQYWMESGTDLDGSLRPRLNGQKILLEEQRIEDASTMMEVMELSEELDDAKTQHEALSTLTARLSCSGGPTPCPKSGQGSDSDAFLSEGKSFGSQLRHGGSASDTEGHQESLLRCVHRGKGHRTDAFRRASLKCLEMSLFKPRGGRESLRNPVARIVFGLYGRVAAWKRSVGTSAETKLSRGARSMTRHGFRRPEFMTC